MEFNDLILDNKDFQSMNFPILEERNDIGIFFDFAYGAQN